MMYDNPETYPVIFIDPQELRASHANTGMSGPEDAPEGDNPQPFEV